MKNARRVEGQEAEGAVPVLLVVQPAARAPGTQRAPDVAGGDAMKPLLAPFPYFGGKLSTHRVEYDVWKAWLP